MFENQRKMIQLAGKARRIQKELRRFEIEATSYDDKIKVVFNGEQKLVDLEINEEILKPENKRRIESELQDAIQQAMKEAQKVATEKMREISGDLGINLPGM